MTVTTAADEQLGAPSDAELISSVRAGDVDAYGELFTRHHAAAQRLARQLLPGPDADDLVSEAFAKVLNVLIGGGGPDLAFRAYLLTAVRRLHVDRVRAIAKATPTDDLTPYDRGVPFSDTVIAGFEGSAAAKAFASLPERWQMVLWHLEVEGQKPAEVALLLGMSANSVSALAYRAREGLRQAFLQMHAADLVGDDCRWTHDRLGSYVRNGLSRRDTGKVEHHLESCRRCTAMYLELLEVNSSMGMIIGPLILGGATAAYLGATATAAASSAAGAGFLSAFAGRVRDLVVGNATAAAGIGAVATVATVAATVALVNGTTGAAAPRMTDAPRSSITAPSAPGQQSASSPDSPASAPGSEDDPVQGADDSAPVLTDGRVTGPGGSVSPPAAGGVTAPARPGSSPTPASPRSPSKPPTSPATPASPVTTPTDPPATTPPPTTTPEPKVANAGVKVSFKHKLLSSDAGLLGNLVVTPSGVPSAGATVSVKISDGRLVQVGSGCSVSGGTATCQVGADSGALEFKVYGLPILAIASISLPPGWTDSAPGNNSDQLVLTLL